MPTLTGPPITLTAIQTEFSTSGLVASSTAAGLDPLPTSMLDFIGLSAFTANLQVYSTVGTTNLTIPSGCTSIQWIVVGGGGAGGGIDTGAGAVSGYHCGGGGGGGGVSTGSLSVTAGQSLTLVIGAAGSGGSGNPDNWTSGGNSTLTYAGTLQATSLGGQRGYYAVKSGLVGPGGTSSGPTANPGGNGIVNRGSGGGGGSGGVGGDATGTSVIDGTGGDGGAAGTFSITGLTFTGAGGGGGGGTVFIGNPGTGGGFNNATDYGGGGGGELGETPASFGGKTSGGNGFQGAIAIWYA